MFTGEDIDYLQLYDLERYLFETVHHRFHRDNEISAFDFFSIVIWKANRAKSKVANKLRDGQTQNLDEVVRELTRQIATRPDARSRLDYLIVDRQFRLPMATAILCVFYPEEFTVYDIRVCNQLGDYHNIGDLTRFEKIWEKYLEFRSAVVRAAPANLKLRDKDRWLWARSFAEQLQQDIDGWFGGDAEASGA